MIVETLMNVFTIQKHFPFLRLPAEVRNTVYQNSNFYISRRLCMGFCFYDLRQPPMTRVNKQLRYETLPIFYENQEFQMELTFLWDRADDDGDDD